MRGPRREIQDLCLRCENRDLRCEIRDARTEFYDLCVTMKLWMILVCKLMVEMLERVAL